MTSQIIAERLRVASTLLRLPADACMKHIRAIPASDRAALTARIDWVLDYEANEAAINRLAPMADEASA